MSVWRSLRWLTWSCALALGACAGTETGNPSFEGSLGYDAYSSAPRTVALTAGNGDAVDDGVRVDNAWLVLGDVQLLRDDACAQMQGNGTHVQGLGAGDHVGGQASATPFEASAGRYCGARLPFLHAAGDLPNKAPDSLRDESIVLIGTLPDGRAYELRSALETSVLLRAAASGFELDAQHPGVLIGFDVAEWLSEMDWSQASALSGRVLIDAEHNDALLSAFERALPHGVALFRDANGDGMLDADHTPIASAP